jgi:hypothetical protein
MNKFANFSYDKFLHYMPSTPSFKQNEKALRKLSGFATDYFEITSLILFIYHFKYQNDFGTCVFI